MARSHHRKKHKQHLQQFKQHQENWTSIERGRTKASWVFGIGGAILGFAVGYFASNGAVIWMIAGLIAGSFGGYLIGRRIDTQKSN